MHVLMRFPEYAECLHRTHRSPGRPLPDPRTTERRPRTLAARHELRTGFEPFVLASVAGLGLWALLLGPLLF